MTVSTRENANHDYTKQILLIDGKNLFVDGKNLLVDGKNLLVALRTITNIKEGQ